MKVLLAEDSLTMMITTSKIIKNSGHEVIPARDGREALSLYYSENPDLVLLDVEMPELTGFEVAEKIRADNTSKWIPIIFLTFERRATVSGNMSHAVRPGTLYKICGILTSSATFL